MAEWKIQHLTKDHDRSAFSSGNASLDKFIRTLASQYEKRRLGRTYVATDGDSTAVVGYYTLAMGSIALSDLAAEVRKKLPQHPIPSLHLGRLAVDQSSQGQRLGEELLFHALRKALASSEEAGAYAVDVWAIDEKAKSFYEKYGFVSLADNSLHLYVLITSVEAMFAP